MSQHNHRKGEKSPSQCHPKCPSPDFTCSIAGVHAIHLLTETVASCCPTTGACVPCTTTLAGSARVATGIGIGVGCSTEESQTQVDTALPVVSGSTANSDTDPKRRSKAGFQRELSPLACMTPCGGVFPTMRGVIGRIARLCTKIAKKKNTSLVRVRLAPVSSAWRATGKRHALRLGTTAPRRSAHSARILVSS